MTGARQRSSSRMDGTSWTCRGGAGMPPYPTPQGVRLSCELGSEPKMHLIDEPTPFEPLEVWKAHLADLLTIPERGDPMVKAAVERAHAMLREIEAKAW